MDEDALPVGPTVEVVDPDVRAHVYSLVTALGGFNGENADQYVLGDDALACLRDIRRWLKLYDERYNRMDVARCLGEANLVNGDLLPILSVWWNGNQASKYMSRIALACMELLVPLTWPLEMPVEMTANHLKHVPYLQHAHVAYKRGFLTRGVSSFLRGIIRIALPSMAVSRSERTTRDEGILKLMLYMLRNIAIITPNTRLAVEGDEEETSRSATINAFQEQDAFALLLTMCSNVGDEFTMQDMVLLEIIFHLVKGVDVEKLFMSDAQRSAKRTDELDGLLKQESSLRKEYAKNAPTRHGRFGTMIWVKRDDAKVSTVSGQDVLKDSQATLYKMDQSKKWNKPQPRRKEEPSVLNNDFSTPTHLTPAATKNLRMFVEEFLDSGFNPLLTHVRKAIEREADRVIEINSRHYFYLVAWFLEAERTRRMRQREKQLQNDKAAKRVEPDSFGLIASVLNQETFIFLNRSMQYSLDQKDWEDLNAEMRCFTQVLVTVQEMALSPVEEDQEIAENIQNRIFYEETTHDRILAIVRDYKDQGFGYLDACTELSHVFLRMLERYSKENADMQVRSRRRARRKETQPQQTGGEENEEDHGSEEEDNLDVERISRERKFDFKRFSARFCNQKCVDTFVSFAKFYQELNPSQLKRLHRYFYRIAFKQDMSVLLFRLDIINLFNRMIKGPGAIESSKPIFKEWEELVRQVIRRLVKKLDQRPALVTELLFSKINSTVFYLEYGHEKQTISTNKRAPAELEVNPRDAATADKKINVVIGALVMDEKADLVSWVSDVLGSAAEERDNWEAQEVAQNDEGTNTSRTPNPMIAVKPRNDECKDAMFYNAKLRLLMTLVGFERLGMVDILGASWVVPSSLGSKEIRDVKSIVDQCFDSPFTGDSERNPSEMIRRKYNVEEKNGNPQPTLGVNFGTDSEGEDTPNFLFPPNPRSKGNALEELKKKRKKRNNSGEKEPMDEEALEERRRARLENSQARAAKIKSDLFVHSSDDESDAEADAEFFRLEEQRRKQQAERIKQALLISAIENVAGKASKRSERKRHSDSPEPEDPALSNKRQRRKQAVENDDDDLNLDIDDDLTLGDEPEERSNSVSNGEMEIEKDLDSKNAEPMDEDDDTPVTVPSRRRMRAGFVIDSDSE
ncbi:Topoisomerase 1-associated factor 1 [Aspergillus nanangensis]|uniref:Topoisomerase 1-associated factor 1 n=1 Tax=Aspergillus nanangensis TaxID=2582783 RepID=A0AAD4CTC9_ASPNN|nr:Topoisomerase 1-associated factor 1 [Aspergillus nanangensis]